MKICEKVLYELVANDKKNNPCIISTTFIYRVIFLECTHKIGQAQELS